MKLARLDTRITLQEVSTTTDAVGGAVESWTDIATVWAERRNLKGRELVEAGQRSAEAETVFTIRYSGAVAGLLASGRIKAGAVYFAIVSPPLEIPGGRPEKIEILARRVEP